VVRWAADHDGCGRRVGRLQGGLRATPFVDLLFVRQKEGLLWGDCHLLLE
jgi:hypothetical protein